MVCIFCIAVLAIVAGAITAASVDQVEQQLEEKASDGVSRVSDTESVARFELTVEVSGKDAPVAVTLYKDHSRVRIQILTHELTDEEVERLEDELAEAIGARIVDRSDPDTEPHEEESPEAEEEPDADREVERERVEATAPPPPEDREREPEQPRPSG